MAAEHTEPSRIELGGLASDGYELIGRLEVGAETHVIWCSDSNRPRYVLDKEGVDDRGAVYIRLSTGATPDQIVKAHGAILKEQLAR